MLRFVPTVIFFFIVVISLSFMLWYVLKQITLKQSMDIAQKIQGFELADGVAFEDTLLNEAYQKMRSKFKENIEDYKRLNSYLSHEQKNEIAILRTSLEQLENQTLVYKLDQMSESIDDILTLTETTSIALCSEVDVVLVCAEVSDKYRAIYPKLFFEFDAEECLIFARERWIYRCISNLIDNAIKYGRDKNIYVTVRRQYQSVIITVEDEGIGIPVEKQREIFNNRYRINELNKNGYGIGLSLVNHVCDLCQGVVVVESEVNKGTVFYLSFPAM